MGFFHYHKIVAATDPRRVEREVSWVVPRPPSEVLHPFEPLTRLGKLQHRVVVVDLMRDVFIPARLIPVALESEHEILLIEHLPTSWHRWFESSGLVASQRRPCRERRYVSQWLARDPLPGEDKGLRWNASR